MIGLVLSTMVMLAGIGLLQAARAALSVQDESARVHESGLLALASIERAVRQAGYENWAAQGTLLVNTPALTPAVLGLDNARSAESQPGLASSGAGVNGSDVLALRFFGSGSGVADGTVVNCAGTGVAEPASGDLENGRGWSIFHIASSSGGEPELRCKYLAASGASWNGEALVSGVESMQVLYGVDLDGDGRPERYVRASLLSSTAASGGLGWKSVVAVRVALLLRGQDFQAEASGARSVDLLGPLYTQLQGSADAGVLFSEEKLPAGERRRLRRLFSRTIYLKQPPGQYA